MSFARNASVRTAIAAAFCLFCAAALGQAYPAKAIKLVVPFPPGGGADVTARTYGQKIGEGIGQTVIVENRGGAGGNIGTDYVARSDPDGYTLLLTTNGHTIQPHLYKLTWDPVKDFAPVSLVVTFQLVIAVNPSVPANTLSELIAFAKSNPGKLTYGSSGTGGPLHLAAELFKNMTGVNIVHVPYKGNAPMTTAVVRGEVDMVFDSMTGPLPQIRAGKLRAIAVTGPARSSVLPNVPTAQEAGIAGFEYVAWTGILAPAGTPRDVVERLNTEIVKASRAPDLVQRLTGLGYDVVTDTPKEFASRIARDLARFGKVVKDANIRGE